MSIVVVFTSRRTLAHDAEYAAMAVRMERLVAEQPGFLGMTSVRDPVTRQGITVARFDTEESVRQWKGHPEHADAQRRGAADFYEEYHVVVARVEREYGSDSR